MEAVRILKALDLKPRRTVRIALWSGEEQGLFGSRGYVAKHFGQAARPAQWGEQLAGDAKESTTKPEHEALSAYFNLDNGTGRVRGVYLQGNEAVRPDLPEVAPAVPRHGRLDVVDREHGGNRSPLVRRVGLPGFQFHPGRSSSTTPAPTTRTRTCTTASRPTT